MRPLNFSSNTARSAVRELPVPAAWTDPDAESVYRAASAGALVDMYLVEANPQPECTAWPATPRKHVHTSNCAICAGLRRAYGDVPHVIAYRLWDDPGPGEDAQHYLARHIVHARQLLGGVPWHGDRP